MSVAARILALSGGVGGARLASGLASVLPPGALTIAVNVGDDFEHLGLTICPDIDTVLYTLGGVVHPGQGWGREHETWNMLDALRALGGDDWFLLGDRDLALHLVRQQALLQGRSLSQVTAALAERLGVTQCVVPVTDARLRTRVHTAEHGVLDFQEYFVRRRCEPTLRALSFDGADAATMSEGLAQALANPALRGIVICPSNPYLSVAPMLAVPGVREALREARMPVVAVSPIIGGAAVKGPTAKIMRELGVTPDAIVIATEYADFVDCVVVDEADAERVAGDARFAVTRTLMRTPDDRAALARYCLERIEALRA